MAYIKKKNGEAMLFIIVSKICYNKLSKEIKDLYNENVETLKKVIYYNTEDRKTTTSTDWQD